MDGSLDSQSMNDYAEVLRQLVARGMPGVEGHDGGIMLYAGWHMVAGAHRRGYMREMGPEREPIGLISPAPR